MSLADNIIPHTIITNYRGKPMKTEYAKSCLFAQIRRALLLLPLAMASASLCAETATTPTPTPTPPDSASPGVTPLPQGACPLNSGGPSLLGTHWRLFSLYGNEVPTELEITMEVGENSLKGFAGCNDYTTSFKRVGHTGFMMTNVEKGQEGCKVLPTEPGGPTINVGNWEGGYIRTLQRAGSVEQVGNTLHFYNRNGEPSVVFAKKYGSL
jgi:hypothetical protein